MPAVPLRVETKESMSEENKALIQRGSEEVRNEGHVEAMSGGITPLIRSRNCMPSRVSASGRVCAAALLVLSVLVFMPAAAQKSEQRTAKRPAPARRPTIVFMTDFGIANDAVAICKGVILGIAENVRILDLSHTVTPFSIEDGARFLAGTTPYYPTGTIFLVVIDPGVGSARKALVVKSKRGQFFVLPDNGLMTLVQDRDGLEGAREIANPAWMIGSKLSSTFHGRDIFSPTAAHLAAGWNWVEAGPQVAVADLVRADLRAPRLDADGIHGDVVALDDPFGNLVTNIPAEDFLKLGYNLGDSVAVRVGGREVALPYVKTFSDVPRSQPLLYIDSRGRVGLAIYQGDFSRVYKMSPPLPVFLPRKTK
jgi:S-adenosylmethionine hydrolase